MQWQLYLLCLRRFFLSSTTHFHSTLSIYGNIWLTFGNGANSHRLVVPIHPSCANSPRPVVNFIFFNKTKTEAPEVLKMYICRVFMHRAHACCNLNLAVSMTSLEAIKKGVPNRPALPYILLRTNRDIVWPLSRIRCESDDTIWLRNHASRGCWFQTLDVNKPWHQIPADRLLFWCLHIFFPDYPKATRRGEISFKSNHVIERSFEAANGRITELVPCL